MAIEAIIAEGAKASIEVAKTIEKIANIEKIKSLDNLKNIEVQNKKSSSPFESLDKSVVKEKNIVKSNEQNGFDEITHISEISRDIIPDGNGGINKEGRTLGEIAKNLVPDELIEKFKSSSEYSQETKNLTLDCIEKSGSDNIPQWADGKFNFDDVALDNHKTPLASKDEIITKTGKNPADITSHDIRDINYKIVREDWAKKLNCTPEQAGKIIGELDLVIHEDVEGYGILIPNNIHRYKNIYSHNGYTAKILKEINGKIITGCGD